MQRSHVDTSNDIGFGASKLGSSRTDAPSKQNLGSSSTMQRSHVDVSNSITFGSEMSGDQHPSSAPSYVSQGLKFNKIISNLFSSISVY